MYYLDVRADFGETPPRHARLTILKSRYDAMLPLMLVDQGVVTEIGVALEVDPSTERVIFWVATEGEPAIPEKLAATLQVREPTVTPLRDDLDSLRLPTVKLVLKESLTPALLALVAPPLATLGEIMDSDDFGRKIYLLGQLLDHGADIRLVEAAVRDVELCEHTVPGFMRVVFPDLTLNDPVHTCLVVFHPSSPPYLVNQCLAIALEHADAYPWRDLARAAALVLCRRARSLIDDDFEALASEGDPRRLQQLRALVGWADARKPQLPPELQAPVETYLEVVGRRNPQAAEQAVLELMTHCGFISLAAELD
jgi:hypothetical protein